MFCLFYIFGVQISTMGRSGQLSLPTNYCWFSIISVEVIPTQISVSTATFDTCKQLMDNLHSRPLTTAVIGLPKQSTFEQYLFWLYFCLRWQFSESL